MMRYRFMISLILAITFSIFMATSAWADKHLLPEPIPDEGGMYTQDWFMETFLDLREDVTESAADGKQLVIFWEQKGCPYCREMHRVNLRIPKVVDYIKANYNVIQLNLWGDREVTDLDGTVMKEKDLARKYRIQFTPTLQYFPKTVADNNKQSGADLEVWRLMGYWKPFHFLSSFMYVRDEVYKTEPSFQRYIQARGDKLRSEGKTVVIW